MNEIPSPTPSLPIRQTWLDRSSEPILEPSLPIVDAHHHLLDRGGFTYLLDELLEDTGSGHTVVATVFVEWYSGYRPSGPEEMRPVGETAFASDLASRSASGPTRACAAIVAHADLTVGAEVEKVLVAHLRAGGERLRGIRHAIVWDADPAFANPHGAPVGLMGDTRFREGFARLAPLGLSFDAMLFHPQIDELADLAGAFPATRIVLDHFGVPLGVGRYANARADVFAHWSRALRRLARHPNVFVKLGGLGMRIVGSEFHLRPDPPTSQTLAERWRPYVETCVEAFGTARCMFESNFPVDKGSCSYAVLWNAFKRLAEGASEAEKADLFAGTARTFYRLEIDR